MSDREMPAPAAVHEAGHVVVAYATGRRVALVRIGSDPVREDHPHFATLSGSVAGGETRFAPDIRGEMQQLYERDEPYRAEHLEWLRSELVTCFAGVAAEIEVLGSASDVSGAADVQQARTVVSLLGIFNDADGGSRRVKRAEAIAHEIVAELSDPIQRLATTLSRGGTFDEAEMASLLEEVGVTRCSHQAMLGEIAL